MNIPIPKNIPIFSTPDEPLTSTTQDFLPIADIKDDLIIFKDGGAALVMESTALNFSLLSEKEQEAVIAAYAAMLNSLTFAIQILIRSRQKNIQNYIDYLKKAKTETQNSQLAELIEDYTLFINETVKKKNVLEKKFYIIIPFSPFELGAKKSMFQAAKVKGPLPYDMGYLIGKAKIALYPKRDHLKRQAGRLGLDMRQLETEELIRTIYDIYNVESVNINKYKETAGEEALEEDKKKKEEKIDHKPAYMVVEEEKNEQ